MRKSSDGVFVLCVVLAIIGWAALSAWKEQEAMQEKEKIESTRRVIQTCTVKSNIEGVITLNDDCKITVIGEE